MTRKHWCALILALALAPRTAAAADKLDDLIGKTEQLWDHYRELQNKYQLMHGKWDVIYKPVYDQQKNVEAAKKAMDAACAGKGRTTPACSDGNNGATIKWAAEVNKRTALESKANELDPKHEYSTETLNLTNVDLQKSKTDFEASRDQVRKLISDAKAHAKTKAEREKIDQKLAQRETKRGSDFKAGRSGNADAKNPGTGTDQHTSTGTFRPGNIDTRVPW